MEKILILILIMLFFFYCKIEIFIKWKNGIKKNIIFY